MKSLSFLDVRHIMREHFALNITMLAVKTNMGIEKFTI